MARCLLAYMPVSRRLLNMVSIKLFVSTMAHLFLPGVFQDFAKVWEVTLQTSSSYHPQSNGLADQTSQRESTS